MNRHPRLPLVLATTAAGLLGCAPAAREPLTQLVVVVDTDLAVPADLDEVRFAVAGPAGRTREGGASLAGPDAPRFPLSFGVVPGGGAAAQGPVSVTLFGRRGGQPVVERRAVANFVRGETRLLRVSLRAACRAAACGAGQTCVGEGACADPRVAGESLPRWPGPGVSAGGDVTCALASDGAAACWGKNVVGQAGGEPGAQDRVVPEPVPGLGDVVEVAAGEHHACARRASGAVVCWGDNSFLQLGASGPAASAIPVEVPGVVDAVQLDVGRRHSCALRASGRVTCWGRNGFGELGTGAVSVQGAPADVAGVTDAVEIATTGHFTCARRATGRVLCWGANLERQLGDAVQAHERCSLGGGETGDCSSRPVEVVGVHDAVGLAAGWAHACALRPDGSAACWGWNANGQIGNGDIGADVPSPAPVSGLSDAVQLATGFTHTCARRAGGAVVCWGHNFAGQLGTGTRDQLPAPAPVPGVADAAEVVAGDNHTCVRRLGGDALLCWGENDRGQLGDGTTETRLSPVAVLSPASAPAM